MKRLFLKATLWLSRLWSNRHRLIVEYAIPTVKFLEAVKRVVDNPALDIATELTKTKLDDLTLSVVRAWVAQAVAMLNIVVEGKTNNSQMITLLIAHLIGAKRLTGKQAIVGDILASVATEVIRHKASREVGPVSSSEARYLVELAVQLEKEVKPSSREVVKVREVHLPQLSFSKA